MPVKKPDAENCPLCDISVEAKRTAGIWEFTCNGTHATGQPLSWTWEGHVGVESTVPSWEQPRPIKAQPKAKPAKDAVETAPA